MASAARLAFNAGVGSIHDVQGVITCRSGRVRSSSPVPTPADNSALGHAGTAATAQHSVIFSSSTQLKEFARLDTSGLEGPFWSLACSPFDKSVWVGFNSGAAMFDSSYKFVRHVAKGFLKGACTGIAFDTGAPSGGLAYLADEGADNVLVTTTDGLYLRGVSGRGHIAGTFRDPYGIAVDAAGAFYVADAGNTRIQKFLRDTRFTRSWGGEPLRKAPEDEKFVYPTGLAMSNSWELYVVDSYDTTIQVQAQSPNDVMHVRRCLTLTATS